jgi:hypothetical protein
MKSQIAKLVVFRNGDIEVGTGEPGYRWQQGWSIKFEHGGVSNPMSLSNVRGMAKRDGQKLVRCQTEIEAAREVGKPVA